MAMAFCISMYYLALKRLIFYQHVQPWIWQARVLIKHVHLHILLHSSHMSTPSNLHSPWTLPIPFPMHPPKPNPLLIVIHPKNPLNNPPPPKKSPNPESPSSSCRWQTPPSAVFQRASSVVSGAHPCITSNALPDKAKRGEGPGEGGKKGKKTDVTFPTGTSAPARRTPWPFFFFFSLARFPPYRTVRIGLFDARDR